MKNKGYAKFGVANMVHYGKCASGVLPNSKQGGAGYESVHYEINNT